MVCKNCGNIVAKTDRRCKSCGEPILPDGLEKQLERQEKIDGIIETVADKINNAYEKSQKKKYRSRWTLLFMYWLGGYFGLHHLWMGDSDKAREQLKIAVKHFLLCFVLIGIILVIIDVFVYLGGFIAIFFGRYKTDYKGNPIVWFKIGKPKLQ